MDASIRQLLAGANAVKAETEASAYLHQAYKLLDAAVKESAKSDDAAPCGSDLFVIAAETAYKLNERKLAEGALQMYFQGTPLTDQFLCRAYLCKAQLLANRSPSSSTDLDSAVVFLLKAINFAKDKPRYHFIVFNASVLFWQMARPFMRPGMRGLLHQSLQQIVKALDDIDDQDHDWRATLMVGLIESLIDAGKLKEATTVSESAADFTLKNAKLRFKDVFRLRVKHKLVEQNKLAKGVNSIPEFLAFLKLQKVKRSVQKKSQDGEARPDIKKDVQAVMKLVGMERGSTSTTPNASRKKSGRPGSPDSVVRAASMSPQRRRSRVLNKALLEIPENLMDVMGKDLLPGLLLEIARFCTDCEEVGLARECLKSLESVEGKDAGFELEIECLKCQMLIKDLGDKQEMYIKSSVDVRLFAIKRMDQHIQNAVRSGNASVVQTACVTQWNICLPLLQPNLRKNVRRPLTLVAQALEDISSLEIKTRCQIHTELAKCEEDVEQVEAALRHIRKALQLDQSGLYHQRLQTMLRRLELSTQLYQSPETPEDTAAVIIEQARKSADSGTVRMKRSLLVKAGLALAPDAFQYVLDSEGDVKVAGQKSLSEAHMLGAKAAQWQKCVRKAAGHLKRLGDENDRERARLWGDLAKVARKQEVWDVCRIAARFCLLYDDNRWGIARSQSRNKGPQPSAGMPTQSELPESQEGGTTDAVPSSAPNQFGISTAPDTSESVSLHDTDLLRMLAEVQFINGEALVHLLQCQGLKLNQTPRFPSDAHQRPRSTVGMQPSETDAEWITYTEWIRHLSNLSARSFLRAIELGIELRESWIVCSGTAYLWNYNKHLIADGQLTQLVEVFQAALIGLRTVGHSSETVSLVRVCNLIAQGLLRPWMVSKPPTDPSAEPPPDTAQSSKPPSRKKTPGKASVGASGTASVDPDSGDDLKQALEVCEYAMQVTNGTVQKDIVPIAVRRDLIATWVLLKQMLQQQIGPGLGVENEAVPSQRDMTKSHILLEMHTLNSNGMMEFTCPTLEEAAETTEASEWNDPSIELEVWTRLSALAHTAKDHSLVVKCAEKALAFDGFVTKTSKRAGEHKRRANNDFEVLSYASCILGESVMNTVTSNPYARRKAMELFAGSAKYADFAGNYDLVMAACRWWWNACLPLMSSAIERELLRQPLTNLLYFIRTTAAKLKLQLEKEEKAEAESKAIPHVSSEMNVRDQDGDNALRASMYGVLFKTYTDKGEWEEALTCMDQAIHHMPRTKHRLPIFKDRIMVKAKLGRSVDADIAKFREESEEYVAHMWHRVAVSSHEKMQQLSSYQKAIESLHSEKNEWVKFEYLAELSSWLYFNEYPKADAINVLEWASDILFGMEFEQAPKEEEKVPASKGKGKKTPGKPGKTPASRGSAKTREGKRAVKIDPASKPGTSEPTKPAAANKEKSENPEDLVPVEKEVIIGLEKANLNLKVNQLNSVRQLEGLIRCHVMLSTISGRGSVEHKSYCLLAVGFVMRMWEIALTAAGPLVSQLPKTEDGGKGAPQPPVKEKTHKKGPAEAVPETYADWATYTPTDDICRAFVINQEESALSEKTITKAELTVHFLDELVNELVFLGYDHLALPVLSLTDVITSTIIGSASWADYVRLRKIKACYDLGLVDAAKTWETKIGPVFLPEEEQSSFVQEQELMSQHAKQVAHEEARIKAESRQENRKAAKSASTQHEESVTPHGRVLKGTCMRRLWLDKSVVLLSLGYYQNARGLLDQSLASATAMKDENLKGDVYLALAQLAIQESNLGQGIRFLKLAQDIGGDEQYWFRVVKMLTDSILLDPDVTPSRRKEAYAIIKSAMETIEILQPIRKTKVTTLTYITSMLEARLALIKIQDSLSRKDHPVRGFQSNLARLETAEETLFSFGYVRETAAFYREHAAILIKLFERTVVADEKHALLLSGLDKLNHGIEILTGLFSEVSASVDQSKNAVLSLPVLRELCDAQLDLAEYSLYMYEVFSKEEISSQMLQAKSGSLEHILKEYIGNQQNLSDLELAWKHACNLLPQNVLSVLLSTFSFTQQMPRKKARSVFLIGRALRILGTYCAENVDAKWSVLTYNISLSKEDEVDTKPSALVPEDADVTDSIDSIPKVSRSKVSVDSTLTVKQKRKLAENAERLLKGENASKSMLCQASEVLLQSVKIALELGMVDIVKEASLELVEIFAQLDSHSASLYLSVHQSATVSLSMRDLLIRSQPDPSVSQLSALLHQESWLLKHSPHMHSSSVSEWIQKELGKFTASKRLSVLPNAVDLLKDFPPNFNFVVLQHSTNRNFLYAALLDKPKPGTQSSEGRSKGKDKHPAAVDSRANVLRISVDPNALDNIKERMEEYGMRLMSFLLQSEYQRAQMAMRKKMLEQLSLGNENPANEISKTTLEEQEEEEMKIVDEFQGIVESLENYLAPVTSMLKQHLIDPLVKECKQQIDSGKEVDVNAMESIVLLLDEDLMFLPIEALQCFQTPFIDCMSRDFSLQMSYHRWHVDPEEAAAAAEKRKNEPPAKGNPKTPKTGKDNRKTPGGGGKVVPLNREVLPGCLTMSTNSVHYIVDPLDESAETEEYKPMQVFSQVLQTYATSCTSMWTGLVGSSGIPSAGQWEQNVKACDGFIFYGMERFLANLPPSKAAAFDLSTCQIMVLLDKAQTSKSFRHQSKVDVDKSDSLLALEKPLPTIMLLSLVGVNAICGNLWHSTLEDNANKLQTIARVILEEGQVIGKAIRSILNPRLSKPKPRDPPPTAPKDDAKGGKAKAKSDSRKGKASPATSLQPTPEPQVSESPSLPEEKEESPVDDTVQASWCNTILFGLPNIMVV